VTEPHQAYSQLQDYNHSIAQINTVLIKLSKHELECYPLAGRQFSSGAKRRQFASVVLSVDAPGYIVHSETEFIYCKSSL